MGQSLMEIVRLSQLGLGGWHWHYCLLFCGYLSPCSISDANQCRALGAKANLISALTGVPHEKLQVYWQRLELYNMTNWIGLSSLDQLCHVCPRFNTYLPIHHLQYLERSDGREMEHQCSLLDWSCGLDYAGLSHIYVLAIYSVQSLISSPNHC